MIRHPNTQRRRSERPKMAKATKAAKRKHREDFSQAAVRIVREATKNHV